MTPHAMTGRSTRAIVADEALLRRLKEHLGRAAGAGACEPATRFAAVAHGAGESAQCRDFAGPPLGSSAILNLARRFHGGETTPAAVVREALSAAHAASDRFNAFLLVLDAEAVEDAGESDRRFAAGAPRSPLEGVPIAVKDVIALKGHPTTGGSAIPGSVAAEADGECARRLKEAGAVIVGKTALHEWAYGVTSDNPFFGTVRNPVDPGRIPGGSSGGSAAAVAAGAVPAALGSDTGGSVRIPAAACGLVGFKPTYDVISRDGSVPQAWSLDHIGVLATSVTDAWLVAEAAARGARGDFGAIVASVERPTTGALEGRTLGVLAGWEDYASETVWRRHCHRLALLRAAGVTLKDVAYPDAETAWAAWLTILIAESAAYHAGHLAERAQEISDDVRVFLETGARVTAQDYLRAQQIRRSWREQTIAAMADIDAVICPTLPDVAPEIGVNMLSLRQGEVALRDGFVHYQWPANLAGAPSISLPGARSRGALPVGLMLTGRAGEDRTLIDLALRVERCFSEEG